MVCHGPEPPEDTPQDLIPPPFHNLPNEPQTDESDDETFNHDGYEPLAQGPDAIQGDNLSSDDEENNVQTNDANVPTSNVPFIEPVDRILMRELWNVPRSIDPIQMDNERAQQVMSAMANFVLPQTSIPEWAKCTSEEQWKQQLQNRIEKLKSNT